MSFCWVLFTFNKYSEFLASLVMCINETVGLWRMCSEHSMGLSLEKFVLYVTLLVEYNCHFVICLIWDMMNYDKIWGRPWCWEKRSRIVSVSTCCHSVQNVACTDLQYWQCSCHFVWQCNLVSNVKISQIECLWEQGGIFDVRERRD